MINIITEIIVESWLVLGQMAPYLIFGFLIAGLLSVLISPQWVERNLGENGLGNVLKASVLGVPLPLCSCGVIPVSASIRRHGASRASTTSFLLSTPQTGVDSIAITYALLGPVFAVFRPIAALFTGIFGGWVVQMFDNHSDENQNSENEVCHEECCNGNPQHGKLRRALHYGMVALPRDIGMTLLAGIVIAGMMTVLIPAGFLENYIGYGALSILLMMLVGVPIYVCATASVPIAAGFLHLGATPGAALAFLIAGPATNAAAFTTIWKVLGRKTAGIYLATVAISAFGLGLLLDWLFPMFNGTLPTLGGGMHEHQDSLWFSQLSSVVLLLIIGYSYLSGRHVHSTETKEGVHDMESNHLENLKLKISGMNCSHCSASVHRILNEQEGVNRVTVDLKSGSAIVTGSELNAEILIKAVTGSGFSAEIEID